MGRLETWRQGSVELTASEKASAERERRLGANMDAVTANPPSSHAPRIALGTLVTITLVAFALCIGALLLRRFLGQTSLVWHVNAFLVAVLISSPRQHWLPILVGGWIANLAGNLIFYHGSATAPLTPIFNTLEIYLCAELPLQMMKGDLDLSRPKDLGVFTIFGAIAAPLVSGLTRTILLPDLRLETFWNTFSAWWSADALSMLIVTPSLLALRRQPLQDLLHSLQSPRDYWPFLVLAATLALAFGQSRYPALFLVPGALTYVAFKVNRAGVALAVIATALTATLSVAVSQRIPTVAAPSVTESLLTIQIFLATMTLLVLHVSAALAERDSLALARLAAEDKARESHAELARVARHLTVGELATTIAHEVNQPLAAICASSEASLRWLSKTPPDIEQARLDIERTVRDARRASAVIGQTRAMLGKASPTVEPFDVNTAIRETLGYVQGELRATRVSVKSQLASRLPKLVGDRIQFQQVMLNLIINGIDAMRGNDDRPRILRVASENLPGVGIRVSVEDSGQGMTPEVADRVFDHFYSTKAGGIGLGLTISRSIIEAQGGGIRASQTASGGAMFQFTLPTVAKAGGVESAA
jgi:signal transduction histidine kinase